MRLQAKWYKGFPVILRYSCRYNHYSFIYKTVSQIFEILILSQDFLGNVTSCPWNQPHFLMKSYKSLLSPKRNKLNIKSQTRFCRRKTAEGDNVKIYISTNMPLYLFALEK